MSLVVLIAIVVFVVAFVSAECFAGLFVSRKG